MLLETTINDTFEIDLDAPLRQQIVDHFTAIFAGNNEVQS